MSNDPNCPFGSKPLSPEEQARHDREQLAYLRSVIHGWHGLAVSLKFDGVADALDALAARSAPAVAEKVPLTEAMLRDLWDKYVGSPTARYPLTMDDFVNFARAVEIAHDIGSGSAQEGQAK